MAKVYEKDGIRYSASNHRMLYHPDYHDKHRKPWTIDELVYVCSSWDSMRKDDIALSVGRTHGAVSHRVCQLKKSGQFEHFKNLNTVAKIQTMNEQRKGD